MQLDPSGLSFSADQDGVTVHVSRDLVFKLVRLHKVIRDWLEREQELRSTYASAGDDPFVRALASYQAGALDAFVSWLLEEPIDEDIDASVNAAYQRYATLHGLTYGTAERSTYEVLENGARGPYRRPAPPWEVLAKHLLQGLIARLRRGEPAPTLKGMCAELNRQKIKGAPTQHATLSRWVSDSRRAAGLRGGYRDAINELLPAAQHQVDSERTRARSA